MKILFIDLIWIIDTWINGYSLFLWGLIVNCRYQRSQTSLLYLKVTFYLRILFLPSPSYDCLFPFFYLFLYFTLFTFSFRFPAKKLERLSLLNNPVTTYVIDLFIVNNKILFLFFSDFSKTHYRHFLIYHLQTLRFLDFQHVKDAVSLVSLTALWSREVGIGFSCMSNWQTFY